MGTIRLLVVAALALLSNASPAAQPDGWKNFTLTSTSATVFTIVSAISLPESVSPLASTSSSELLATMSFSSTTSSSEAYSFAPTSSNNSISPPSTSYVPSSNATSSLQTFQSSGSQGSPTAPPRETSSSVVPDSSLSSTTFPGSTSSTAIGMATQSGDFTKSPFPSSPSTATVPPTIAQDGSSFSTGNPAAVSPLISTSITNGSTSEITLWPVSSTTSPSASTLVVNGMTITSTALVTIPISPSTIIFTTDGVTSTLPAWLFGTVAPLPDNDGDDDEEEEEEEELGFYLDKIFPLIQHWTDDKDNVDDQQIITDLEHIIQFSEDSVHKHGGKKGGGGGGSGGGKKGCKHDLLHLFSCIIDTTTKISGDITASVVHAVKTDLPKLQGFRVELPKLKWPKQKNGDDDNDGDDDDDDDDNDDHDGDGVPDCIFGGVDCSPPEPGDSPDDDDNKSSSTASSSSTTSSPSESCTSMITATEADVTCSPSILTSRANSTSVSTICKTSTSLVSGCSITPSTTTRSLGLCSSTTTATDQTVMCSPTVVGSASTGFSYVCSSSTSVVSGCDVTATTTTSTISLSTLLPSCAPETCGACGGKDVRDVDTPPNISLDMVNATMFNEEVLRYQTYGDGASSFAGFDTGSKFAALNGSSAIGNVLELDEPADMSRDAYLLFMTRQWEQATIVVPHGLDYSIHAGTTARVIEFKDQPATIALRGLTGCTSVAVISERGAWVAHIWDAAFAGQSPDKSSFDDVMFALFNANSEQLKGINTLIAPGGILDPAQQHILVAIITPSRLDGQQSDTIAGPRPLKYSDSVAALENALRGRLSQGNYGTVSYLPVMQRLSNVEPFKTWNAMLAYDARYGTNTVGTKWTDFLNAMPLGRVVVQFEPAQTCDDRQYQMAEWRLYADDYASQPGNAPSAVAGWQWKAHADQAKADDPCPKPEFLCSVGECGGGDCDHMQGVEHLLQNSTSPNTHELVLHAPPPGNRQARDKFMHDTWLYADEHVELRQDRDSHGSSSNFIEFGDTAVSMAVSGMFGCTSAVVISRKGAWASHIWDEHGFLANLNDPSGLETMIGELLDGDDSGDLPGLSQFALTGEALDAERDDVHILLITSTRVMDRSAQYSYPELVYALEDRLAKIWQNAPDTQKAVYRYHSIWDWFPQLKHDVQFGDAEAKIRARQIKDDLLYKHGYGKVVIQYDPSQSTCDAGDMAIWRVYIDISNSGPALEQTWLREQAQQNTQADETSTTAQGVVKAEATACILSGMTGLPQTNAPPVTDITLPPPLSSFNDGADNRSSSTIAPLTPESGSISTPLDATVVSSTRFSTISAASSAPVNATSNTTMSIVTSFGTSLASTGSSTRFSLPPTTSRMTSSAMTFAPPVTSCEAITKSAVVSDGILYGEKVYCTCDHSRVVDAVEIKGSDNSTTVGCAIAPASMFVLETRPPTAVATSCTVTALPAVTLGGSTYEAQTYCTCDDRLAAEAVPITADDGSVNYGCSVDGLTTIAPMTTQPASTISSPVEPSPTLKPDVTGDGCRVHVTQVVQDIDDWGRMSPSFRIYNRAGEHVAGAWIGIEQSNTGAFDGLWTLGRADWGGIPWEDPMPFQVRATFSVLDGDWKSPDNDDVWDADHWQQYDVGFLIDDLWFSSKEQDRSQLPACSVGSWTPWDRLGFTTRDLDCWFACDV